jgi:outer membrane immunogenic protein
LRILIVAAVLAAVVASPAIAADLVAPAGPDDLATAPVADWSGPYAGILAGYGMGVITSQTGGTTGTYAGAGWVLGGTLGVNAQSGNFVYGAEADLARTGIAGGSACAVSAAFNCAGSVNWVGTLAGRAGIVADGMLLYGKAGLAAGGVSMQVTPTPLGATGTFSDVFVGWTAGVGVEFKLAANVSLKAEVDHIDLGSRTAPAGTVTTTGDSVISPAFDAVKVGLNFAF